MNNKIEKKAKELVDKYFKDVFKGHNKIQDDFEYDRAKQCAIKCLDEMIILNGDYYLEYKLSNINYDYYVRKNAELFQLKEYIETKI
jgi:hypothetical protein